MAWGCDPDALSADPYTGAHSAVYTSVAKICLLYTSDAADD